MVFGPKVLAGLLAHVLVPRDIGMEASIAAFVVLYTVVAWKGFLVYTSKKDVVGALALHILSVWSGCPLFMLLISVLQRI